MGSALEHPQIIQDCLDKECSLGRMLGPFRVTEMGWLLPCHINRFGQKDTIQVNGTLIPSSHFPRGKSVNDGIDSAFCSLLFTTMEQVAAIFSRGALLANIDMESAYRLVPVHPVDHLLQVMRWKDAVYVDPMLPFSLQSAPKLFNAVADALEWHVHHQGVQHIFHYLDDFIVVGATEQCAEALFILDRETWCPYH